MKKASVLIISVLILLICATAVWQWGVYSKRSSQTYDRPDVRVSQEVTMIVNHSELEIKQVFINLKNDQNYGTVIPKESIGLICKDSEGSPCDLAGNQQSIRVKGDKLTFTYTINIDPSAVEFFIHDWLVLLRDSEISNTRIEIVDKLNHKGTWVTGIPLKGSRRMELVNYYVFEGREENPSLYWQNKSLRKLSGQKGISYYPAVIEDQLGVYHFDRLKGLAEKSHVSVIVNNENRIVHGSGILLLHTGLTKSELEQQLAISFFSQKFHSLDVNEKWILEALASLITNEPAVTSKSQFLIKELKSKLTQAEINHFINRLSVDQFHIDHNRMDGHLSVISKMKTNFFALNRQEESKNYPLLFMESRKVIANGLIEEDMDIIIEGEKRLYPFIKTMSSLGYKTEKDAAGAEGMKVSSNSNSYSFNFKNKTFILNGKSFGLLEDPFRTINDTVYIEEQWLNGIFDVIVEESEKEIVLTLKN
jgi:hypothetical protein